MHFQQAVQAGSPYVQALQAASQRSTICLQGNLYTAVSQQPYPLPQPPLTELQLVKKPRKKSMIAKSTIFIKTNSTRGVFHF